MAAPAASGRQRGRGLALIYPTPTQSSMPKWYTDCVAVKAKKLMLGFRRPWFGVADTVTGREVGDWWGQRLMLRGSGPELLSWKRQRPVWPQGAGK